MLVMVLSIPSESWIECYRFVPFYYRVAVPSDSSALKIITEPMYTQIGRCVTVTPTTLV